MLKDIARVNALLGGRAAAGFGFDRLLEGATPDARLTLLDVGAGSGDLARYLAGRAAKRGVALAPLIIERHPVAARLCRRTGLTTAVGDGGQLPLADHSVDVVLASQLLHHLERGSAVSLLVELDRVARLGVIVADLRRHPMAALGIWLASYPLRLHPITRRDGVTSVRRGFTRHELAQLLREAGVTGAVFRRPGYRLVAVWRAAEVGRADG
ncbi:MAG: methyltransferase domain-containing protein [Gemmatimonadetes bacterium]|nr:methyltransferase domain-containing protein [Gemmatimonadota bacterium]